MTFVESKTVLVQVLPAVLNTPYKGVALDFHWIELLFTDQSPLLAYAINGSFLPSFCEKMAPTSRVGQSASKIKSLVKSGLIKMGVFTNARFNMSKSFWQSGFQANIVSFVSSKRGTTMWE